MTLSRMIMRVGMDVMPKEAASACSASVSTLAKTASGCCSETRSKIGANIRHGPHQDAQKSTRARSAPAITVSKFSAVSSTVAMVQLPPRCRPAPSIPYGVWNRAVPATIPSRSNRCRARRHSARGADVVVAPTMTRECLRRPNHGKRQPGGDPPGRLQLVICVLGDAHLDVIVSLAGPVQPETDTPATATAGAGGQAANVAAWIVALGGRARLIAAQADDPAGRVVAGELTARGVELAGPVLPGRTGVVVSLSDTGRSRSMLTDRGVGPELAAGHLVDAWFAGCTRLHLPGYSLLREPVQGAALAAARRLPRLSVDLSSTSALRDYGVDRFRALLAGLRPQTAFGTEEEADLVGEVPGAEMVVKLGPRGVRVGGVTHAAVPVKAVDTTGAGDAFAAGYLLGGVSLGLAAAARAVGRMGAMP